MPEIVSLLLHVPTEILGYLKFTNVLKFLLIGHWDSKLLHSLSNINLYLCKCFYDVSLENYRNSEFCVPLTNTDRIQDMVPPYTVRRTINFTESL